MKKSLAALAFAALLGALAGASGCADNRASIQIQMICQPSEDCVFDSTCPAEYGGYPTFDRSSVGAGTAGGLVLFLQVANQLPNNEDLGVGRLNTNDANVDELAVTLEGAVNGEYTIGANGRIPAEGSTVVGVPIALGTAGEGEVLASVRLRGYYDHAARFETGEFRITLVVCSGCLGTLCAAGAPTCPEGGEGQRPLTCGESTTPTPTP